MKTIPLTQGQVALVDDEDYDFLMQWKWHARKGKTTYYAKRMQWTPQQKNIHMHRVIMGTPNGMECDHRDHNGLNNQKYNLRNCTHADNQHNNEKQGAKYRGLVLVKGKHHIYWQARIRFNKKGIYIGTFYNKEDAARAYDAKAKELFGEFANVNFKEPILKEGVQTKICFAL